MVSVSPVQQQQRKWSSGQGAVAATEGDVAGPVRSQVVALIAFLTIGSPPPLLKKILYLTVLHPKLTGYLRYTSDERYLPPLLPPSCLTISLSRTSAPCTTRSSVRC